MAISAALYVSNRGHNSIARFTIDPARLTLSPPEFTPSGGRKPRHFALDPTGKWLIAENQESGNLVVFALRQPAGKVVPSGHDAVPAPAPLGLVFVPVP
jgi:6-phosphogluconolactonase